MKNDETLTVSINCTSYPLLPPFTLSLLAWLMQSKLLGRRWEPNEWHAGYLQLSAATDRRGNAADNSALRVSTWHVDRHRDATMYRKKESWKGFHLGNECGRAENSSWEGLAAGMAIRERFLWRAFAPKSGGDQFGASDSNPGSQQHDCLSCFRARIAPKAAGLTSVDEADRAIIS
jgi:hypothetical protein